MSTETTIIARPWERAGITYRQFDHWVTMGWVSVDDSNLHPGYGNNREITREQFGVLAKMARLTRHGVKPSFAAKFVADGKADKILEAMDA